MANNTPTTTDTFPKMGDEGISSFVNMSGQRSPYTMPQARQGPLNPDVGGGNGSARRSPTEIHDANGPAFRPMATRGWATDYAATGRAVRSVPSALGNRDFWSARANSNAGDTVA